MLSFSKSTFSSATRENIDRLDELCMELPNDLQINFAFADTLVAMVDYYVKKEIRPLSTKN